MNDDPDQSVPPMVFPMDERTFVDWANRIREAAQVEIGQLMLAAGQDRAAGLVLELIDQDKPLQGVVPFIPAQPQTSPPARSFWDRLTRWLA